MSKKRKKNIHTPTPTVPQTHRQHYWFTSKKYGYGWTPASWEGWVVLGTYIVVMLVNFFRINAQTHSVSDALISYIPEASVITFLLFYICIKTGEPARWRWGK